MVLGGDMKEFIEVISNDIISWESIRAKMKNNNGVVYQKNFSVENYQFQLVILFY